MRNGTEPTGFGRYPGYFYSNFRVLIEAQHVLNWKIRLVPTVIPPLLPPVASLHNAPAMIEMNDGVDGQGSAMSHAQKAGRQASKRHTGR